MKGDDQGDGTIPSPWRLIYFFRTAFAVVVPAIRPKVIVSDMELPPRRFAPWTPPVTSPAA